MNQGYNYAKTSLILGIISLVITVLCCGCGGVVPLIISVIGIVYAAKAKEYGHISSMRSAGLTTNIISIVLSILATITLIILYSMGIMAQILAESGALDELSY